MDKHIYRSFVIAVTSSDEYNDSITQVAAEPMHCRVNAS